LGAQRAWLVKRGDSVERSLVDDLRRDYIRSRQVREQRTRRQAAGGNDATGAAELARRHIAMAEYRGDCCAAEVLVAEGRIEALRERDLIGRLEPGKIKLAHRYHG